MKCSSEKFERPIDGARSVEFNVNPAKFILIAFTKKRKLNFKTTKMGKA